MRPDVLVRSRQFIARVDQADAVRRAIDDDASPSCSVEDVQPQKQSRPSIPRRIQVATLHQTPSGLPCKLCQFCSRVRVIHLAKALIQGPVTQVADQICALLLTSPIAR